MEDSLIINLYWQRDEAAITVTGEKYGRYCHAISYHILQNNEDAEECIASGNSIDEHLRAEELAGIINAFLAGLAVTERRVFMCRYWHFDSVRDISDRFGFTQSKVKMMLKRTREKLLRHLEKEGIWI